MEIPKKMTMNELRDFTNKNMLYYYHVFGTKGKVAIYEDRNYRHLLGFTEVTDYKPIKNFKSMGARCSIEREALKIVRKRIKDRGWGLAMSVSKPED